MKKNVSLLTGIILLVVFLSNSAFVSSNLQSSNADIQFTDSNSCIGCHLTGFLTSPQSNIVHNPSHVDFRATVTVFLNTHDENQAAEKQVDIHKLALFLENLDSN